MIRLAISVEGQTEEEFVKTVLADHLREAGVEPTPIMIGVAYRAGRGGSVSVEHLSADMAMLYGSCDYDAVTSLVDFYGFRGREDAETVDQLEERIYQAIRGKLPGGFDPIRTVPYVQRYEFEGLLFSDVNAFLVIKASNESLRKLQDVRAQFPTPEHINDHPETAPSKRITGAMPRYRKVVDGALIATEAGLPVIRRECPRFNGWVERLNALGSLR